MFRKYTEDHQSFESYADIHECKLVGKKTKNNPCLVVFMQGSVHYETNTIQEHKHSRNFMGH